MAKETKAEKKKRLMKSYNQWQNKKALAYRLAEYYWTNAYKSGGSIPQSVLRKWAGSSGWDAGLTIGSTTAKKRGAVMNSPTYQDVYYPDGKSRGTLSLKSATSNLVGYDFTTFSFNATPRDDVDPKGVYTSALRGKSAKDRHSYMQNQYKTVIPAAMAEIEAQLNKLGVSDSEILASATTAADTSAGDKPKDTGGTRHNYSKDTLAINVGMVNEAYFSQNPGFTTLANLMDGGNKPHEVADADKLWKDSMSNKGMFWLYVPKNPAKDSYTLAPTAKGTKEEYSQYVFQFHYNPPTVSMAWSGNPQVDVSMESSGSEKFNNMSTTTTSVVSFDLVLNRIFDMQYYTSSGALKSNFSGTDSPYSPKSPTAAEQTAIYNKGTMYDIEHLLGTSVGFKLNTRLRGKTTDIGFLTGRPVDLHLGNNLRYWGYIQAIRVEHRIFDERMVPIFSTVSVDFARIPDYGGNS
jgi:hypothetical protein